MSESALLECIEVVKKVNRLAEENVAKLDRELGGRVDSHTPGHDEDLMARCVEVKP